MLSRCQLGPAGGDARHYSRVGIISHGCRHSKYQACLELLWKTHLSLVLTGAVKEPKMSSLLLILWRMSLHLFVLHSFTQTYLFQATTPCPSPGHFLAPLCPAPWAQRVGREASAQAQFQPPKLKFRLSFPRTGRCGDFYWGDCVSKS